MRPSFIYHQLHVSVIVIGLLLMIWLVYNGKIEFASFEMANLIILLSIGIGIHALIHFEEEVHFDFNPMTGDTTVYDKPYYPDLNRSKSNSNGSKRISSE